MGRRPLMSYAKGWLGRWFSPVSQSVPQSPPSQEPEPVPAAVPAIKTLDNYEDILRGMPNLQKLKSVIKGFTQDLGGDDKKIFELKGSGYGALFQDIVLTAPDGTTFALRLHDEIYPIENNRSRQIITGLRIFEGSHAPVDYDLTTGPEAEQRAVLRLLTWLTEKCPTGQMPQFDALLVQYVQYAGEIDNDDTLVRHVPGTFAEVVRPSRGQEPS